jgi:hypothetical protein
MRQFSEMIADKKGRAGHQFRVLERSGQLEVLEAGVYPIVQRWLDRCIHQRRPLKSEGIFDFVPSETELKQLLKIVRKDDLNVIIDGVFSWLKQRLEQTLDLARKSLINDLEPELVRYIEARTKNICDQHPELQAAAMHVGGVLVTSIRELSTELTGWFQSSTYTPNVPATLDQMRMVIDGRYSNDISNRRLKITIASPHLGAEQIDRAKVRSVYDLVCELINNALKHGSKYRVQMRISGYREASFEGLIFTSTCDASATPDSVTFRTGHPSKLSGPEVFAEGNSGLSKVASIAASIVGHSVQLAIYRRKLTYHVKVPFRQIGPSPEEW